MTELQASAYLKPDHTWHEYCNRRLILDLPVGSRTKSRFKSTKVFVRVSALLAGVIALAARAYANRGKKGGTS